MVVGTGAAVVGTASSGTDTSSFFTVRTLGPTGAVLCARTQHLVSAELSRGYWERAAWRKQPSLQSKIDTRWPLAHQHAEAP